MSKRHDIQYWSKVSYEDSDVLPYDSSADIVHFLSRLTKIQGPEKSKKKEVILKSATSSPHSVPKTKCLSPHSLHFSASGSLPCCSSAWKALPPHGNDRSEPVQMPPPICNFHQHPQEQLLSLRFHNNHYTDILPEFLPISLPCDGPYSWYYSDQFMREEMSGTRPSKGHLKALSWGTRVIITTANLC